MHFHSMKLIKFTRLAFTCFVLFFSMNAHAGVVTSEYKFNAVIDNDVLPDVFTEVWGRLYRPSDLGTTKHPLIILLHGNHATCGSGSNPIVTESCEYTFTGSCAAGQEQIYSFRGYDYLGEQLASRGYIVVSINANRGITCGKPVSDDWGLNLARGRLVLRHLALLSQWNHYGNAPASIGDLRGKIDFSEVGMLGHSRGGEGVRAALNLYQDPSSIWKSQIKDQVDFKGIFEIGPVDGQTSRTLDASGTAWNVLLPSCDGDVSDLEGMKPFDRMESNTSELPAKPKSMYYVWGANHDYYNTEWQTSDSPGCVGTAPLWSGVVGSSPQRQTAIQSVVPFFLANVGKSKTSSFENEFDPLQKSGLGSPRVDRSFHLSTNSKLFVNVDQFNSAVASSDVSFSQSTIPEHDNALVAAKLSWSSSGNNHTFENDWKPSGQGSDASLASTFDFRVARTESPLNPAGATDFHIQLVYADNSLSSAVALSSYASLVAPIGSGIYPTGTSSLLHSVMQTVRIPLIDLTKGNTSAIRGVRFIFDSTAGGEIYLSRLGFSRFSTNAEASEFEVPTTSPGSGSLFRLSGAGSIFDLPVGKGTSRVGSEMVYQNDLPAVNAKLSSVKKLTSNEDEIELVIHSDEPFGVKDALPIIEMNGKEVGSGAFSIKGDLHFMSFRVKKSDIDALPTSSSIKVRYRGHAESAIRNLGAVAKAKLQIE